MKRRLAVRVAAATVIVALLSSVAGAAGAIVLAPGNDNYQRAIALSNTGGIRTGTTLGATAQNVRGVNDPLEWIPSGGNANTVWYKFGGRAGVLTVDTCTSPGFNTLLEVFERPPLSGVRYSQSDLVFSTETGCALANGAYLSFPVRAQTTYYIRVRGASSGASGDFTLTWSFVRGSGR